ncbi:MAG: DUF4160 domain-containing protein [Oscillospiraceae bacterium]|nr:DUF4160 domain-containing protein [Oscillospiraceae bacterium]
MPSLFQVRNYRVFFWSNENNEPIHVHIGVGKPLSNSTKIWLTSKGGCIISNNNSRIHQHDLNELLEIISAQYFFICTAWKDHFKVDTINYYC